MAATTYITSAEAAIFYDDALYGTSEKAQALLYSFGLLNSYLNSALLIPTVPEWNGSDTTLTSPVVLKLGQGKAYEYLLRRGEVGDTPDVLEVFAGFVAFAQSIIQENLTVPEAGTFEREAGWHIVNKSNAGGGDVYIRGGAPSLNMQVKLVITDAATATYPETFTYTLTEPWKQSANVSTGNVTSFDWLNIAALLDGTRPFELRWVGKWTNSDYVEIRGVAAGMIDTQAPPRNTIQQSAVAY